MRNRLPHDLLGLDILHITYRLAGSIPRGEVERIVAWRREQLDVLNMELLDLPPSLRPHIEARRTDRINAKYERRLDRALHATKRGPFHLQHPGFARIVLDSWLYLADRGDVFVYAICVMGNHVHIVMRGTASTPIEQELGGIIGRHKRHTARLANRLLGRTGHPFWEADFFDRRIRKGTFMRVMWYVLQNPVAARLVPFWQDWPNTFLHPSVAEMFTGVISDPV